VRSTQPTLIRHLIWNLTRCRKDQIEEALFERRRDLFTEVDLVFFDTTSLYFEGAGGEDMGERGYNKDHRPDLRQRVVGLAVAN
jgi:transposase